MQLFYSEGTSQVTRMNGLREVLGHYLSAPVLGDESLIADPTKATMVIPVDYLRRDVTMVGRQNAIYFAICFAVLIVLFLGACLLVMFSLNQPKRIVGVLSATGLSFFGIVGKMLALWKEKVRCDLLLVLISNIKANDLKPIMEIVARALA
jgi:hypothetical protein